MGFGGPLYHNHNKEPLQNSIGNHLRPYITPQTVSTPRPQAPSPKPQNLRFQGIFEGHAERPRWGICDIYRAYLGVMRFPKKGTRGFRAWGPTDILRPVRSGAWVFRAQSCSPAAVEMLSRPDADRQRSSRADVRGPA